MSPVVVELAMLGLALLAWSYARHAANRALAANLAAGMARDDAQAVAQVSLVLARAVLDHEDVDKLAAGVTWAPRDELDELLLGLGPAELSRRLLEAARADRGTTPP